MTAQHPSLLATDQELLQLLHNNPRQSPDMLVDSAESTNSKQHVQNRLKHLRDNDLAHRPSRGIYELTARGERAADNINLYATEREEFWSRVNE